MVTAEAILTVVLLLFAGSVLHRALANFLLSFDGVKIGAGRWPSERDIFFVGLLPALVIVGTVDTCLGLFHIFRADVVVAVFSALVLWRRRDAIASLQVLKSLFADLWWAVCSFEFLTLAAVIAFFGMATCLFLSAELPSDNVDVWAFQLPLAKHIVSHAGFVYQQQDQHAFYSNNPLFFNLLFAHALLFVDHFIAADAINIAVFFGFLLGLLANAQSQRGLAFLLIVYLITASSFFSPAVPVPLTDLPRSCFSVLALISTDRYLRTRRLYDIVVAGLLVGAAVAGKYTELVTVILIGICLFPSLLSGRLPWSHVFGFCAALGVVASYWYVKNLVLFGNPIYPFLFGHPGLTDEWMAEYMRDLGQAFDPADRRYITDLMTLQGWHDFGLILYRWFFAGQIWAKIAAVLLLAAVVLKPRRLGTLVFCIIFLFIVWYALMFNQIRWAMPAYLLFFSTAFIGATIVAEAVSTISPLGVYRTIKNWITPAIGNRTVVVLLRSFGGSIVAIGAVLLSVSSADPVERKGGGILQVLIPAWLSPELINIVVDQMSVDDYLATHREGYAIYRYVGDHDLRVVFQPLDSGAVSYASAYNGGTDRQWILGYGSMPTDLEQTDEFFRSQSVRYFIC